MIWVMGVLGAVVSVAAVLTAILPSARHAVFALWVCASGLATLYWLLGFEMLALVQWLIATSGAVVLTYSVSVFGDVRPALRAAPTRWHWLRRGVIGALGMSGVLAGVAVGVSVGVHELKQGAGGQTVQVSPGRLLELASVFSEQDFLAAQTLGLFLVLTAVGAGVIARPEATFDEGGFSDASPKRRGQAR